MGVNNLMSFFNWIQVKKINWFELSKNPNAIHIL